MRSGALENAYIIVWIEDEILMMLCKKDAVIGLGAAKEIIALCEDLTQGVLYPSLIYMKHVKVVSLEARKFFAAQGDPNIKGALIVDSGFSKILGNMFFALDRPLTPLKMFTEKSEAIKWLKEG